MIELKNLNVTFGAGTVREKIALRDINLKIDEGQFITVIGSNGAGKSTLLNTIAGEIRSTSGQVLIDDEDVTRKHAYECAAHVARVFQDPLAGTCGDLTVAENMALAESRGYSRGISMAISRDKRNKYREALATLELGLEHRLDTSMSLLSGGQRQAVSLLMATMSPLKILLLDEHTSALDPKTAASVMDLTQKIISEKSLTALMVTHSLHHALDYGTKTVMLHGGRVIYEVDGKKRDKLTIDDLMAQFGKTVDDDSLLLQK